MKPMTDWIVRIATALAALLALAVALYALFLLVIGQPYTVVEAVPAGVPMEEAERRTVFQRAPIAVVPLLAALLLLGGLWQGRLWIAWAGFVPLALFAGLFLFSIGGILLPIAGLLMLLLIIITIVGRLLCHSGDTGESSDGRSAWLP